MFKQENQVRQNKKNPDHIAVHDNVKAKVEKVSGLSLKDVNIVFNSDKPKKLNAHAFTQGTNVWIGPGKEKYLEHELKHVVQQKEGRVPFKKNDYGYPIVQRNDLELEADKPIQLAPIDYTHGNWTLPKMQAKKEVEETLIRNKLAGIVYRYGGSFAAYFHGGKREPQDIDIEVQKDDDIKIVAEKFQEFNPKVDPHYALIEVPSSIPTQVLVNIDVVNENDPFFHTTLENHNIPFQPGEIVEYNEIILNYLDRAIMTPNRSKNDFDQIVDIVNETAKNYGGDYDRVFTEVSDLIKSKVKRLEDFADNFFRLNNEICIMIAKKNKSFLSHNLKSVNERQRNLKSETDFFKNEYLTVFQSLFEKAKTQNQGN